jgi:hypothetical protein
MNKLGTHNKLENSRMINLNEQNPTLVKLKQQNIKSYHNTENKIHRSRLPASKPTHQDKKFEKFVKKF